MSPGADGGGNRPTAVRGHHPVAGDVDRADDGERHGQRGVVSLEWVLALPLLVLAVVGVLEVAAVVRDALVVHEAARAGVRAAATSTGTGEVEAAIARSLPDGEVVVMPSDRSDGDIVEVEVALERSIGPVTHRLSATATARVEPAVAPVGTQP